MKFAAGNSGALVDVAPSTWELVPLNNSVFEPFGEAGLVGAVVEMEFPDVVEKLFEAEAVESAKSVVEVKSSNVENGMVVGTGMIVPPEPDGFSDALPVVVPGPDSVSIPDPVTDPIDEVNEEFQPENVEASPSGGIRPGAVTLPDGADVAFRMPVLGCSVPEIFKERLAVTERVKLELWEPGDVFVDRLPVE